MSVGACGSSNGITALVLSRMTSYIEIERKKSRKMSILCDLYCRIRSRTLVNLFFTLYVNWNYQLWYHLNDNYIHSQVCFLLNNNTYNIAFWKKKCLNKGIMKINKASCNWNWLNFSYIPSFSFPISIMFPPT